MFLLQIKSPAARWTSIGNLHCKGTMSGSSMRIGVPREIKNHEYRVGLTPESVRALVVDGHQLLVETNAGTGIGALDDSYRAAGAKYWRPPPRYSSKPN